MEVTDYSSNKGIIPIQLGNARIIQDYTKLLHIINISTYEPLIQGIKDNIDKQQKIKQNINLDTLFLSRNNIINNKVQVLQDTLNHIKPIQVKRPKRGIHIIFGDIPFIEYTQIKTALNNVHTNEKIMTDKINEQISLNNKMINRFRDIENAIASESKLVQKAITEFRNTTQDILEISAFEQFIHNTEYNIDRLQRHLDEILNTITLAKQGYISHYLITNEEAQFIINQLQDQNIKIISEYQLYQFIEIKTIFKDPLIIFIVSIPKFYREIFKHYYIIPITINQTYSIPIPNHYITMNDHKFQYSNKPCNQINNEYYCREFDIQLTTTDCIAKIISNIQAPCNLINEPIEESIMQVFSQYLIINKRGNTEYSTTCGIQETRYFTNIKLIKFNNCSITINETVYQNKIQTFNEELIHLQPFHEIIIKNISTPIDLPQLTNWSINNIEKINNLRSTTIPNTYHHTYWTISTCIIVAIIIYLIIWRYCPSCTPCAWYNDIKGSPIQETYRNTEDSIILRGEQLRNGTPQSTITTDVHHQIPIIKTLSSNSYHQCNIAEKKIEI